MLFQPAIRRRAASTFQPASMFGAAAVYMVNVHELAIRLAATYANITTVSCKYLILKHSVASAVPLQVFAFALGAQRIVRNARPRTVAAETGCQSSGTIGFLGRVVGHTTPL